MITREKLLGELPPFENRWVTIKEDQHVADIIKQILVAHKKYRGYYDRICLFFDGDTVEDICNNLYKFCKEEIQYDEEPEHNQTTALPAGILSRGVGDCKHYASFIGGCLSAISRMAGKKIDWRYRFASYNVLSRSPHHVFIVVRDKGNEFWIDPVPGADKLTPVWILDKKIQDMPLRDNIGAVFQTDSGNYQRPVADLSLLHLKSPAVSLPGQAENYYKDYSPDINDADLPPAITSAINLLIKYDAFDKFGDLDNTKVINLTGQLPPEEASRLNDAVNTITSPVVSGLFSDIWRGVKKVTIAGPRGAFLSAVALNVFGMATKLKQATKTTDGVNKIRNRWYKLGGDWAKLRSAIDNGAKRHKIGGFIGVVPAVPAWVATAGAIIAAMMPLVNAVLKQQKSAGVDMTTLNAEYGPGNPYSNTPTAPGVWGWVKSNPVPVIIGAFLLINFVVLPKDKRLLKL